MAGVEGSLFRSNFFRIVLGLALGAVLLYLSVRDVSWADLRREFATLSYAWILAAAGAYWLELLLRIFRWRALLSQLKPPIARYQVATAFLSGYAANNVLPAKLGEPFRADLLGRLANVSRLTAFGSIIVERLFDLVMVLGMTAWGVFFVTTERLDTLNDVNKGLAVLAAPIAVVVILVIFTASNRRSLLKGRLQGLSIKIRNLVQGLRVFENGADYVKVFGSTVVIWMLNCLAIWSILMALHVQLDLNQTVFLIGLTGIAAALPAAPAGIGTLQYAFHIASLLFGFSASTAIAASAMVQLVLLGSATAVGAIAYSYAISHHLLRDTESVK
jgi:glycosyltransferase 2 family protein